MLGRFLKPFAFGLCLFVAWTILVEFFKGARAIRARTGQNLVRAAVELTHRNTRRYGGYIVHLGIVLMFVGFTGSAFNQSTTVEVKMGDRLSLGHYEMRVAEIRDGENDNYTWYNAVIEVSRGGQALGAMTPERRMYKASRQGTSEVAIRRRPNEDLYLNFAGMSDDNQRAVIQAFVFPLVSWIWIGFWVVAVGTLICLVPSKVRFQYTRLPAVRVGQKHVATLER